MEESKVNELSEQVKALTEKLSQLETQIATKDDLKSQFNSLKEEVAALKRDTISKNDMKINVETMKGVKIDLYATKSDTVKVLKAKLQEKENTPQEQLHLFLDGKLLEDNTTVEQNKIKESSKVYLIKDKLLYVVVATNNSVFGIYVSKPIFSDGNTRTDSLQMVISPTHNFSTKSLNDKATYHSYSGKGPQFHCMQINAPFLTSSCTDIQSCSDFNLPCYPTGNSTYQIKEFEVYSLAETN